MENKKQLGQYYTDYNPFTHPAFIDWFRQGALYHAKNKTILEPFAGSNNIVKMIKDIKWFEYSDNSGLFFDSFDIEPTNENVKYNDSINNFPKGYDVVITNPPYLSKVSASRQGIDYLGQDYNDLYELCVDKILENVDWAAIIIPTTCLGKWTDRMTDYILLETKMFDSTETPVALALFAPKGAMYFETFDCDDEEQNVAIWDFEGNKIAEYYDLKDRIEAPVYWISEEYLYEDEMYNEFLKEIKFNDKDGEVFLNAIDNTKGPSIYFDKASNHEVDLKVSSRHKTLIKLPEKIIRDMQCRPEYTGEWIFQDLVCSKENAEWELNRLIEDINNNLNDYRKETSDLLMNTFLGLRKDGKFRRRLDYKTARKIIACTCWEWYQDFSE